MKPEKETLRRQRGAASRFLAELRLPIIK